MTSNGASESQNCSWKGRRQLTKTTGEKGSLSSPNWELFYELFQAES